MTASTLSTTHMVTLNNRINREPVKMNQMDRKLSIIIRFEMLYQQDVTLAVLFISNCKIILHVSDAFCAYHQEY